MTKTEVAKLMTTIAVEFSGRFEITPERVDLWFSILGKYEFKEGNAAVIQALSLATFPPSVSEIRNVLDTNRKTAYRLAALNLNKKQMQTEPYNPEVAQRCKTLLSDFIEKMKNKGHLKNG